MPLTEAPGAGRLVDVADTRRHVVEKSLGAQRALPYVEERDTFLDAVRSFVR